MFHAQSAAWLAQAQALTPQLQQREFRPLAVVEPEGDPAAFQGWRMRTVGAVAEVEARCWRVGESVVFDFGEHLVGHVSFEVLVEGIGDQPVRLQCIFAEVPAEVAEPFDPYTGELSRAWLQDETVTLDEPQAVRLPRRYAFRYLRITWEEQREMFNIKMQNLVCHATTSADFALPVSEYPEPFATIDQVGSRTLRNCMQEVYEDGPKRDRRLWLGDLRVMAQLNYLTFRNNELVKRCLYLFAAAAREDGLVPACVYERPHLQYGNTLLTYSCLFAPTLLDYADASGDWALARELWPVALRQLELAGQFVNDAGVFTNPGDAWWTFFDWHTELDNEAPMHACLIYCLRTLQTLAEGLGLPTEVDTLQARIDTLTAATRTLLWDDAQGFFVSGPQRQVSWCTQVWMTLAGVLSPEEARPVLQRMLTTPGAIAPNGPYLYHHVLEALALAGLFTEAGDILRDYWGGMVERGATAFWEVFNPTDDHLSPYGSHLINSYCHAWSATPGYFLRKYPEIFLGVQ